MVYKSELHFGPISVAPAFAVELVQEICTVSSVEFKSGFRVSLRNKDPDLVGN